MGPIATTPDHPHLVRPAAAVDLARVVDLLPFGVLLLDERAAAIFANRGWIAISGQSGQSWGGHRWLTALERPERGPVRQELISAMASRRHHQTDWVVPTRSGGHQILRAQLTPDDEVPGLAGILTVLDTTEERRRVDQLIELATHDPLTGLVNRHQFVEFLHHALERHRRLPHLVTGVYFVDVDRFKAVNDTYGHSIGDELLRAVGRQLVAVVRPMDVVARFGGDEFVVLCEDLRATEVATTIARRLKGLSIEIPGTDRRCTLSVGWTLVDGSSLDSTTLISRADEAMYRDKQHRWRW